MSRKSQSDRLLELLEKYKPNWCPLFEIMNLRIASHTRRITDLRKAGYPIECRKETIEGQVHSYYRIGSVG